MVFAPSERRLLAFLAFLLSSGFLITGLERLGVLPERGHEAERLLVEGGPRREPGAQEGIPPAGGASRGLVRTARVSPFVDGFLDVNQADSSDFVQISGIGPTLAGRILQMREDCGEIRSLDQLLEIRGIGEKRLAALRQFLGVGRNTPLPEDTSR